LTISRCHAPSSRTTAAIGEDPDNERKEAADLLEHRQRAVAILDIGGLDVGGQDQAERIDEGVPLFARAIARKVDSRPLFPRF